MAIRRPTDGISGQALLLAGGAGVCAVLLGVFALQSRHALLHEALPVLLVPVALWFFFSERYEVSLAVLLLYLGCLDGVVKLASGSQLATLGRDVLLYAIVLGAVARAILRRTPLQAPPFTGFVIAWVAVCVMQLANPADISFAHSVTSLRQHLEFVPLFFFGYFVVRSEQRLVSLLVLLLVVGAANGLADLVEARLSPAHLASWGPGYAALVNGSPVHAARVFVTPAGRAEVRPPGLGGADGFGGFVCMIALPCAIALFSSARQSAKLVWLLIPMTLFSIVGVVTSQTRLDVVSAVVVLVVSLALTLTSRRGLTALLLIASIGLVGYVAMFGFVSGTPNRYSSIAPARVLGTTAAARKGTLSLIPTYLVDYPLGAGIGSVGPAGGSTIGGSTTGRGLDGESEVTFLLVETGIPGLLVMCAFTFATIRAGLALRRLADPRLQRCLVALTAVLITLLVAWLISAVTSDSPGAPFMWLSAGCLAYWYRELRMGRLPIRSFRLRALLTLR